MPDDFVRDTTNGTTTRVSVASNGAQGVGICPVSGGAPSGAPALSRSGRYVAFSSCFTNLVAGDVNQRPDVFVRDSRTGVTRLVSVDSANHEGFGDSRDAAISGNGRYVAFLSTSKLTPDAPCSAAAPLAPPICALRLVYVRDLWTGRTTLATLGPHGVAPDGDSADASISSDGRYVAFISTARNLVPGMASTSYACSNLASCPNVFLHDLHTGSTRLVSVALNGRAGNNSGSDQGALNGQVISDDDCKVIFASTSSDLVPNDTKYNTDDLYVRDVCRGRTARVSVDSAGEELPFSNIWPAISGDGHLAAFVVGMPSPTIALAAAGQEVETHDLNTGATGLLSVTWRGGNPSSSSLQSTKPVVNQDGRYVAYCSDEPDHVSNDRNGYPDVFRRDRGIGLGVGGLAAAGKLTVSGAPAFATAGLADKLDTSGDVTAALTAQGANLISVSLAYRPEYGDLFVRLQVQQMRQFSLASAAIVYGLRLTVGGTDYQIRAAKTGPLTASFGLFRSVNGSWRQVSALRGGYGTTGQEVVTALPLAAIGAQSGGRIGAATAFTGIGSYATGPINIVDTATIA